MKATPKQVLAAFGKHTDGAESLHRWSPVHRVGPDGAWVLKRAATPIERADALAIWTRGLAAAGIRTVCPLEGFERNPRAIEDVGWVVYPFIEGERYGGRPPQILSAGRLLGQIHAFGVGENQLSVEGRATMSALKVHAEIPDPVEAEELFGDLATFQEIFRKHAPHLLPAVDRILRPAIERYTERTLPAFRDVSFPTVVGSWDFKASNLVYERDDQPVLVDPDNGGVIPRIFDLATSVVLFHSWDAPDAPRRTFDAEEWRGYRNAYLREVTLSGLEREHWTTMLGVAWIDEGLFALLDAKDEWGNPEVRPWLESLLSFDPERYLLDG